MNEFELIARLRAILPGNSALVAGAGDDCAVLDLGIPGKYLLFKTDAVAEGAHFTRESAPEKVGRKVLARNLSDVAAMAGWPVSALAAVGLPDNFSAEWVERAYQGMAVLAREFDVSLSGGETTRAMDATWISVAMVGVVEKGRCILRRGSKPGDALFVTGELGGSIAGKHFDFEPRLREARWLAENFAVHAMIDLSDGLAGDLRWLLEAEALGAELLASAIPISGDARRIARQNPNKSALAAALTDGEDFELLFTAPADAAVALLDGWNAEFPKVRLSCIGKITAEKGVRIRDRRGARVMSEHGYRHFEKR